MPASSVTFTVKNLKKVFADEFSLGPIDVKMTGGENIAYLGHNGSGKTTLFQLITGNMDATEGDIRLGDLVVHQDQPEVKKKIGYLPQHPVLPKWITGDEIINYVCSLLDEGNGAVTVKADHLITFWDCQSFINRPLASCSHGMKKRIGLCLANLGDPDVLVLDEPFSGLDLSHTLKLIELIKVRQKEGKINIFSTHIPQYVAQLANNTFFLKNGDLSPCTQWNNLGILERIEFIENYFRQLNAKSSASKGV